LNQRAVQEKLEVLTVALAESVVGSLLETGRMQLVKPNIVVASLLGISLLTRYFSTILNRCVSA
jgi:hypothetical protein